MWSNRVLKKDETVYVMIISKFRIIRETKVYHGLVGYIICSY